MTGFAQVKGKIDVPVNGQLGFTLSVKSVFHRFLVIHFRLPGDCDALVMKLRRMLKEGLGRGHVELTLNLERSIENNSVLNREMVAAYIRAFRSAAAEFSLAAEPDLNVILRVPGVLDTNTSPVTGDVLESPVVARMEELLSKLNQMREEEGRSTERELRGRMERVIEASHAVKDRRQSVLSGYVEKLKNRMQELIGSEAAPERILQEAALLADRSDIQEELVRLDAHVAHFLGVLDAGGEVGKKLDFLLQEMNREANTLLSKTSGLAGDALKITEQGLAIKSEIEKAREQVQNLE